MTHETEWWILVVVILVAFGGGVLFGTATAGKRSLAPADRYEMHVTPAAEIIRLDKTTGALHVLTATGQVRDLP